jgi:hypothetical protein
VAVIDAAFLGPPMGCRTDERRPKRVVDHRATHLVEGNAESGYAGSGPTPPDGRFRAAVRAGAIRLSSRISLRAGTYMNTTVAPLVEQTAVLGRRRDGEPASAWGAPSCESQC